MYRCFLAIIVTMWTFNSSSAIAQSKNLLSDAEIEKLNSYIYSELSKSNTFEFKRVTEKGNLAACSVEFSIAFREYKQLSGNVMVINGSINHHYSKGKNSGYAMKLVAKTIDYNTINAKILKVHYLDFLLGNKNWEKYKKADEETDFNGRIVVYPDPNVSLLTELTEAGFKNASIRFSITPKGLDNEISFNKYIDAKTITIENQKFNECSQEVMENIIVDLENIKK